LADLTDFWKVSWDVLKEGATKGGLLDVVEDASDARKAAVSVAGDLAKTAVSAAVTPQAADLANDAVRSLYQELWLEEQKRITQAGATEYKKPILKPKAITPAKVTMRTAVKAQRGMDAVRHLNPFDVSRVVMEGRPTPGQLGLGGVDNFKGQVRDSQVVNFMKGTPEMVTWHNPDGGAGMHRVMYDADWPSGRYTEVPIRAGEVPLVSGPIKDFGLSDAGQVNVTDKYRDFFERSQLKGRGDPAPPKSARVSGKGPDLKVTVPAHSKAATGARSVPQAIVDINEYLAKQGLRVGSPHARLPAISDAIKKVPGGKLGLKVAKGVPIAGDVIAIADEALEGDYGGIIAEGADLGLMLNPIGFAGNMLWMLGSSAYGLSTGKHDYIGKGIFGTLEQVADDKSDWYRDASSVDVPMLGGSEGLVEDTSSSKAKAFSTHEDTQRYLAEAQAALADGNQATADYYIRLAQAGD
jgi:hypothetical protein